MSEIPFAPLLALASLAPFVSKFVVRSAEFLP